MRGLACVRRIERADQPEILLLLKQRPRLRFKLRRDDHFAKNFADGFRERFVDRPIANDDPAEWRLLVGGESFFPRLAQIGIAPDAARVRVFQNRDGRFGELGDQVRRGADVENVVKGKVLAVELLEMLVEVAVERRGLMRVFAVT